VGPRIEAVLALIFGVGAHAFGTRGDLHAVGGEVPRWDALCVSPAGVLCNVSERMAFSGKKKRVWVVSLWSTYFELFLALAF